MRVFPVVGEFLVLRLDGVIDQTRNGFLTVVEMHKSADLALHVLLIAGIFEAPRQHHGLVQFEQGFFVAVEGIVGFDFGVRVAKGVLELFRNFVPRQVDGGSHGRKGSFFGRRCIFHGRGHSRHWERVACS